MAFLNGIFNKQPAAAPAPAAPAAAPAPVVAAGPVAAQKDAPANRDANPNMMGANPAAPAGGPEASKLDAFKDLFTPKAVDPNAPKSLTLADPLLTPLDPAKFKETVQNANFASAIPTETLTKAMAGDQAAFLEAINIASREAFSAATQLSHGLAEHGARQAGERVSASLDGRIRNNLVRTQNTSNEVLSNPAVAPIFNAVKAQIAQNNPQLSPDKVIAAAEEYFTEMSGALTAPQRQAEQANNTPKQKSFAYLLNDN